MHRMFVLATAVAVAALAACGGGSGGAGAPAATGFTPTSVDSALEHGVGRGLDAIWVYVDDGRGAPLTTTAGVENRGTGAPADPGTLFKIASISKMFIAVCSVRLVNQGTVRLDDTLAFWLPVLAARIANGDAITVRQLLTHRSGVPDFDSQAGFSWRVAHTDVDALLELALGKPADFAPNARYEYSNTNYVLLGKILDAALGYSHREFVQHDILSPLGMLNTYSLLSDTDLALLARGYWDGSDRTGQDFVAPGGSMVSTVADVGVFLRALASGELLDAGETQIWDSLFDGVAHSGWLPGYQSIARYHRASDVVIVQFVNTTGGGNEQVAQEVYDGLVRFLGG